MMAKIIATPKSTLADECLKIRITGLEPYQLVTLQASLTDEKGVVFHARAFYQADQIGEIDLERDAASGGDYSGVQPMGLFSFLKPNKPFSRLMKRDVLNTPYEVQLAVYGSYYLLPFPSEPPIVSQTVQRWYTTPGMQRLPIRHGKVRGALFLPAGERPPSFNDWKLSVAGVGWIEKEKYRPPLCTYKLLVLWGGLKFFLIK